MVAKAEATFNLTIGTGTGTGWTWSAPILTINDGANVAITGTRFGQIRVVAGASVNIILEDITLNHNQSPLLLNNGADVTLTLVGTNTLTAGMSSAGIQTPSGTALTIDGTGSLTARGGNEGAGIGGGDFGGSGTITINGGTITATSGWSGAGIGGGRSGSSDTITINGGTVIATSPGPGAGIGGGSLGAGGIITINGGTVTATTGWNGTGIGGGNNAGNAGTFTMNDNAIVFANSIGDTTQSRRTSGILFIGNNGKVYGNVEIRDNFTIPTGYGLVIPHTSTLAISSGIILTNDGTVRNCGTINTYGTWIGNEPVAGDDNIINMNIENPAPPCDGSWTFANNVYTILDGANVTITGANANQRRIEVATGANVNITLEDVTIEELGNNQSPLLLNSGAEVMLTLVGTNILTAGDGCAGIQTTGAILTIMGMGNLMATGGHWSAGIGGGLRQSGGIITINSGVVTARGGGSGGGAGIGGGGNGGVSGTNSSSGGTITINGGIITAISEFSGTPGIGRGSGSTGDAGTFSMNGNAVVFVNSSVSDTNVSRRTNGILFTRNIGRVYGSIEITDNFTIPTNHGLLIPTASTLTIPSGITLTNDGTVSNCGTINSGDTYGMWAGNEPIACNVIDLSIANLPPSDDGSWTFANNIYTIHDSANVTVTGTSANQRRIEVTWHARNVNITLKNVTIEGLGNNQSPIFLYGASSPTLTLVGENTLRGGAGRAGIQAQQGTALTINGTGSLTARGGNFSAGIGGGDGSSGGTIFIDGGTITAIGSISGAGLGGGWQGASGNIYIGGGVVTAIGGSGAQGIGRGSGSGESGWFTMNNNAVVFTNSVGDTDENRRTNGILFIGNNGILYGESVSITTNVTIPANHNVTIPYGSTLTIVENTTLTNDGTITNNGAIVNDGTLTNNGTIRAILTIVDGGESATETGFQNFGELITLKGGIKIGFVLDNWTSADVVVTDNQFTMLYNAVTVTANWKIATYTVMFNSQGGNDVAEQTIEHGGIVAEPTPPTRTGHTFGGWYRESTHINVWNFATNVITSDTTLFAKWNVETSIADILETNTQIYPNPFSDILHIADAEGYTLRIMTQTGIIVHTQTITSSTETIRLGHLPRGMYILRIGEQSVRLVKQ